MKCEVPPSPKLQTQETIWIGVVFGSLAATTAGVAAPKNCSGWPV